MEYTQKELTDALDLASRQYYNGQRSNFTDTEFDLLLKELQKMERKSGVVYPNSPTARVGSDIQSGFKKGSHPKPMFTIENAYNDEDIVAWVKKMGKEYEVDSFNISVKYDGISCELHYVDGVFVQALTRGDKLVGDDITRNVRTIKNVPMTLANNDCYEHDFYVRGEILLPKSKLKEINDERIANGETPFANTRNACSGSIKQLDPKITAKRGLIFKAWDCFGDIEFRNMDTKKSVLESNGFYYSPAERPYSMIVLPMNGALSLITKSVNDFKKKLDASGLDFDYDGVVIKVNPIEKQDEIGTKDTRAIEWAIARKWNEEYLVKTKLLGVDWQVGRTGVLTPVGRLEPVECGGVVISNVTLNNVDFIDSFGDVHIGDIVKLTRSGGVIPYVLDIEPSDEQKERVLPPYVCPICGAPTKRDGALLKCSDKDCPAVVKGELLQFCSKDCMDIRSIGESVINDLYDKGLVTNITHFYRLRLYGVNEIVSKLGKGYGKKKVDKMLAEIEKSKEQPWERVLAGISIPGVGKVVARTLAKKYDYASLINAKEEELSEIEGIGPIMAHDIHSWFGFLPNRMTCVTLEKYGLNMGTPAVKEEKEVETDAALAGLVVCFTGSSDRFKGDAVEEFLESHGAKCASGVSKKLNYLIIGTKPGGSKVKKAEELGVEIIEEGEFYKKYGLFSE